MSTKTSPFVDLDNARLDEQRNVMKKIMAEGHCPFCAENLTRYHKQPILRDGKYWSLTYNQWPHANTKLNLLIIYKAHAENLSQLDPRSGNELLEILTWAATEFKVPGGGVGIRFGNTDYSAGSVNHIHAQFFVPDRENPEFEPVRFKIGKDLKKI